MMDSYTIGTDEQPDVRTVLDSEAVQPGAGKLAQAFPGTLGQPG